MSLDFSLIQKDQDGNEFTAYSTNFTHNVTNMWREAGCYDALYNSEGCKAKEAAIDISNAVEMMENEPKTFKPMSAPNGWGTYEQALPWLKEVKQAVLKHPSAKIEICK